MADLQLHSVRQMTHMLRQLDRWLESAKAFAEARSSDPEALLGARLMFDQYALVQQVQAACDSAKFAAARVTGTEAPSNPDDEKTLEEIRARIQSTLTFLDGVEDDAFAGSDDRVLRLPFLPDGKGVTAANYIKGFATPNFYFHLCHAYAILRANGVPLGKRDFIGGFDLLDV